MVHDTETLLQLNQLRRLLWDLEKSLDNTEQLMDKLPYNMQRYRAFEFLAEAKSEALNSVKGRIDDLRGSND